MIERILRHCGLWHPSAPRPPPNGKVVVCVPDDDGDDQTGFFDEPGDLTFVPDADWDRQPASWDVPWEVTSDAYGDPLDASF